MAHDEAIEVPRRKTISSHPSLTQRTCTDVQPRPEATREEMRDAKLPLAYRDSCANLLIPLNRCRFETYYLPWKCEVGQPQTAPAMAARGGHGPLATKPDFDGTVPARSRLDGQALTRKYSKRGTATRNANMSSSRSEWLRWTNSEQPRVVRGATRREPGTGELFVFACSRPTTAPEDTIDDLVVPNNIQELQHHKTCTKPVHHGLWSATGKKS